MQINHMKIHELKTIQPFFSQIDNGEKTFEIRINDRDFQTGDYLLLRNYDAVNETYNGEDLLVRVKSILKGHTGIKSGFCIMSISAPL